MKRIFIFFVTSFHHLFYYFSNVKKKELIINDVNRYCNFTNLKGNFTSRLSYLLYNNSSFRNIFYYRIGRGSGVLNLFLKCNHNFAISGNIAGGLVAFHPIGTFINAESIGQNFTCRQCTVIGNKSDEKKDEKPIIGDNVNVGANSVIIGKIRIGNNVIIGAGSVITKSIPDNVIVVGNPGRIIKNNIQSNCCL